MSPDSCVHLFAYFTGEGHEGLRLSASTDAQSWHYIDGFSPLLVPELGEHRLMRDPHLTQGPDGRFHLLWTTGWNDDFIGYASSPDLVNWSGQQALLVMAAHPGTRNCWAPESVYDNNTGEFVIIWASTVEGRHLETAGRCEDGYNHRLYSTRTRDFFTFTPAELFYDPGFPVIDGTLLQAGGQWNLFFKDETVHPVVHKHVHHAASASLRGPWSSPSPPIGPAWAEGPSCLSLGASTLLVFDLYTGQKYGALISSDLSSWHEPTPPFSLPVEARHGSLLTTSRSSLSSLLTRLMNASIPS